MTDTIFALATPAGGALAVIRISGPASKSILESVFSGKAKHAFMAHGFIKEEEKPH